MEREETGREGMEERDGMTCCWAESDYTKGIEGKGRGRGRGRGRGFRRGLCLNPGSGTYWRPLGKGEGERGREREGGLGVGFT